MHDNLQKQLHICERTVTACTCIFDNCSSAIKISSHAMMVIASHEDRTPTYALKQDQSQPSHTDPEILFFDYNTPDL